MILKNNNLPEQDDRSIIAFAHITKTGGRTLNRILRHNYFLRSCDVRPLSVKSGGIFSAHDMATTLKMNPFIECITGHSVRPHSNLDEVFPNLKYISLFRNPVNHYISQYEERVRKHGKLPFEAFLKQDKRCNVQTKFIAETADLSAAKAILAEKFLAVGILEEFDEFLVLLKRTMPDRKWHLSYESVNVAKDKYTKEVILSQYKDRIIEKQQLDIELYKFVTDVVLPNEKAMSGPDFEKDVKDLKARNKHLNPPTKRYFDSLVRQLYYKPVTGIVRVLNGLPYKGLK